MTKLKGRQAVAEYLEAIASGAVSQDPDVTYSFYAIAHNQLESKQEREAFRIGTLAVLSDIVGQRIRAFMYRRKFKRSMNQL